MSDKPVRPTRIRALDLFCGAGGTTCGAELAGVGVVGAVDAWDLACTTYADNYPNAKVYHSVCERLDPSLVLREVGAVELLLASPECTNHTCAKGSAERCEASRNTAFQVVRFAKVLKPLWIIVENVIQMRVWERYQEFIDNLERQGYRCAPHVLNAADFGVPQARRRLFIVCQLGAHPPAIVAPKPPRRTAREIIDTNGAYRYSFLWAPKRAPATLARAERAIAEVGEHRPFLLVYYGNDGAGGWQRLSVPLRTITTLDRFAYVRSRNGCYEMRMLQVNELKYAMGFPAKHLFRFGTRRDRIKLLGNAVCPPVMQHIVQTLMDSAG